MLLGKMHPRKREWFVIDVNKEKEILSAEDVERFSNWLNYAYNQYLYRF